MRIAVKKFTLFFCNSYLVNLDVIFLRGWFWFMFNCNIPLSDPQNCSVGQLRWPLSESDRINGGGRGTYFLPDEVSCNGSLESVHTCFFYNDGGNSNRNDFRLRVGVFRQMGDIYTRNGSWIDIDVTRQNSSETWGCTSINLTLPVLAGDRIAVRLRKQNQMLCLLQPSLNTPRSTSVLFYVSNVKTIPVSQVTYTNVYLDVSGSIGRFNVFHGSIHRTNKVIILEADIV